MSAIYTLSFLKQAIHKQRSREKTNLTETMRTEGSVAAAKASSSHSCKRREGEGRLRRRKA